MKKGIIGILISIWILMGCYQKPNLKKVMDNTSIPMPKEYQLIDFKSDWGVGESSENYDLILSMNSYQQMVKEINSKKFFRENDSTKVPKYALNHQTNTDKINETACKNEHQYFYQIFKPNPAVLITIILERDSVMMVNYTDL